MPEVRLIDANALHAKIMKDNDNDLSKKENIAQILVRIESAPTIEAEPVRHGRWGEIGGYEPENHGFACSACDFATTVKSRFCPNCGARMDGGADNG
jgi:hypothetical protein